jgi:hypothetical protein
MYILITIFIILLLVLIWNSSLKCTCGSRIPETFCGCSSKQELEHFISAIFCDEKLTYDGINYQLWKNNHITNVFKTYDDYTKYWKFAHGDRKDKVNCPLLKPIKRSPYQKDGTIISTKYLQDKDYRQFNIEHFSSRDVSVSNNNKSNEFANMDPDMTKDEYITKTQNVIANYLKKNPECHERLLNQDAEFYTIFQKSYELFLKEQFRHRLGYIPNKTDIQDMTIEEIHCYIDILSSLPNCQELIMRYFKPASKHSKRKTHIFKDGIRIEIDIPQWVSNLSENTSDFISSLFKISKDELPDIPLIDKRGPKSVDDNIASNFAFKPKPHYPQKEANRNIAKEFGWSYIPPQFWSVPQQRPPICLPSKDTTSTVTPIYDKSVPLDALELTKVNFPPSKKGVDDRFLNNEYYYPGIYINKGHYDPDL